MAGNKAKLHQTRRKFLREIQCFENPLFALAQFRKRQRRHAVTVENSLHHDLQYPPAGDISQEWSEMAVWSTDISDFLA